MVNRSCWLFGWHYMSSLHSTDEPQEGRNNCPLLRSCFIGSSHVGVSKSFFHVLSALQSIVCLYTFFLLADQISCRSYVRSVYRMWSLAVFGFILV